MTLAVHPWQSRDVDRQGGLETDYVLRMENRPLWQTPFFDHMGDLEEVDEEFVNRAKNGYVGARSLLGNIRDHDWTFEDLLLAVTFPPRRKVQCDQCGRIYFRHTGHGKCWDCRNPLRQNREAYTHPPAPPRAPNHFSVFQPQTAAEAEAFYEGLRVAAEERMKQEMSSDDQV
jgi:hypothetical protein